MPFFIIVIGPMSSILSVGPGDPAYYTDLLKDINVFVDRPPPFHEQSPLTIVDRTPTQTLLDDLASISLRETRNASATMAHLKSCNDVIEMQLYIVFDHQNDDSHRRCCQHLKSIFTMLRGVPYKPPEAGGSPQIITDDLKTDLLEISRAIHNYSFGIFAHRVGKRWKEISNVRKLIEEEPEAFTPIQHSILLEFLQQVEMIFGIVSQAWATKQLSILQIQLLLGVYSFWTKNGLLPEDALADDTVTLLDAVDGFLAGE